MRQCTGVPAVAAIIGVGIQVDFEKTPGIKSLVRSGLARDEQRSSRHLSKAKLAADRSISSGDEELDLDLDGFEGDAGLAPAPATSQGLLIHAAGPPIAGRPDADLEMLQVVRRLRR